MPQVITPKKKLGPLAWIGIAVVVIVSLIVIKSGLFPSSTKTASYDLGYAKMGAANYAPSAPSVIPERQMLAESAGAPALEVASDGTANTAVKTNTEQRIIKTGELSIRVKDTLKAVEEAKRIAEAKNGYVQSSNVNDNGTGPRSGYLTIRVPASAFEETLAKLKAIGVLVLNENVRGQDVTMQYVDLEADLTNARAEEASYLEIMKRSGKIEEVLMVAQRLADVRGRIERLDGQKRYLENQTDLATITVNLTEETKIEIPSKTWKPYEVLRSSIREVVSALQSLVDFLIQFIIGFIGIFIPVVLLVGGFLWIMWKIVKVFLRRFQK